MENRDSRNLRANDTSSVARHSNLQVSTGDKPSSQSAQEGKPRRGTKAASSHDACKNHRTCEVDLPQPDIKRVPSPSQVMEHCTGDGFYLLHNLRSSSLPSDGSGNRDCIRIVQLVKVGVSKQSHGWMPKPRWQLYHVGMQYGSLNKYAYTIFFTNSHTQYGSLNKYACTVFLTNSHTLYGSLNIIYIYIYIYIYIHTHTHTQCRAYTTQSSK
jgi:hypothetical protein